MSRPVLPQIRSLQNRLLVVVLGGVSVMWLVVALATWIDTEHEVSELLDAHLAQAAALLVSQPLDDLGHLNLSTTPNLDEYQSKVVLQVWHGDDLVVRSATAPTRPLAPFVQRGFLDVVVSDVSWRVFSAQGRDEHVVIQVAEQVQARDDVLAASLRSVLWPMTVALPLLALGVWWGVRHAIKPLRDLGWQVSHRRPDASDRLEVRDVPLEAQPLVTELNRLFDRMSSLIQSERRFTADAAHELRTPLAAIRIQAQVAQGAVDADERNEALADTLKGCDRATRLVEQLLQLARLETGVDGSTQPGGASANLGHCVQTVMAYLAPVAAQRQQKLECVPLSGSGETAHALLCPVPEALAMVLVRNLLDNALRYSPDQARVRLRMFLQPGGGGGGFTVEDSGPGLAPDQLQRLGERFFRVVGTNQPGSGLGWSIVTRIAKQHGLTVQAARSPDLGGLSVTVAWSG